MDQRNQEFALESELEAAARTHSVSDLQEVGVRRVRVLDTRRLKQAARVAINRTLRSQLGGLDLTDAVLAEIERRSLEEFTRLVDAGLAPDPQPTATPANLHSLLVREQQKVHEILEGQPVGPVAAPEPVTEEIRAMETRMATDLSDLIEADWKRELAQVESSHRQQLGLLELRISKLVRALESTDRVLEHLQTQGANGNRASTADGEREAALDPASPLFEKKSQLLGALFQANVKLQELEGGEAA